VVAEGKRDHSHSRHKSSIDTTDTFRSTDPNGPVQHSRVLWVGGCVVVDQFGPAQESVRSDSLHFRTRTSLRCMTYLTVSDGVTAITASQTPAPRPAANTNVLKSTCNSAFPTLHSADSPSIPFAEDNLPSWSTSNALIESYVMNLTPALSAFPAISAPAPEYSPDIPRS
jgi:hypothetical protein